MFLFKPWDTSALGDGWNSALKELWTLVMPIDSTGMLTKYNSTKIYSNGINSVQDPSPLSVKPPSTSLQLEIPTST